MTTSNQPKIKYIYFSCVVSFFRLSYNVTNPKKPTRYIAPMSNANMGSLNIPEKNRAIGKDNRANLGKERVVKFL